MPNPLPANHSSRFLDRLEKAMSQTGLTQTAFGYLYFGDPGFMRRAREGHLYQRRTVDKIESVLATMSK